MEAEKKIREAEYFLNQLNNIPQDSDEFIYNLSAFLTAWRSVLDIILYDYAEKFNLGLTREEKVTDRDFEVAARALQHTQALQFIKWWRDQCNRIARDPLLGKLWKIRVKIVHRGYPPMRREFFLYLMETIAVGTTLTGISSAEAMTPTPSTPNSIPPNTFTPSGHSHREVTVYFQEIPNRNVIEVCDEALNKIKDIFREASQCFGT